MDFTDMNLSCRGYRYLLVIVDRFSGWPEAYPCKRETAQSVIKALTNHYIPTHGFPRVTRSDNGTHFKNNHLQQVESSLGLQHRFGSVYHPQSQGKGERMNRTLKEKLAKIMTSLSLNWLDGLPIALMSVRMSLSASTGFSPFELQTGRCFPGPQQPLPANPGETGDSKMTELVKAYCSRFNQAQASDQPEGSALQQTPGPSCSSHVYLKAYKRKWSEPRWTGPYEVTERTTTTAVRLKGKGEVWYHLSHTYPCPPPEKPDTTKEPE